MSKLSKNLSAVKIVDSSKVNHKKIKDSSKEEIMSDWIDLKYNVPSDKLIEEIENQLPSDVFVKLVEGLKTSFDFDEIKDSHNIADEAWSEADHAAAFAINADDVVDLYLDGIMEVEIPSGIDSKEFAESCIKMCKELWSDEEVNFDYGDVEFNYVIDDNKLIITII